MMLHNTYMKIAAACVIFLVAITAWVNLDDAYMKYYPFEPSIVYGIDVKEGKACKGGQITYVVDIDKKMDLPYTIKRQLVNGYAITFDDSNPPHKPLGRQQVPVKLDIPFTIDSGSWRLRWTVEYEITRDRKISITAESDKFKVVDCK